MRDQAVGDAATGKSTLDAASLNQLNICYGDLRSKAGQYTGDIAAEIRSASFDSSQNQSDQTVLEASIASFNDCLLKVQKVAGAKSPAPSMTLLSADWVPAFGRAVEKYWARDGVLVQSLTPEAKARLIEEIKSQAAWPDFAAIGGGTAAPPR